MIEYNSVSTCKEEGATSAYQLTSYPSHLPHEPVRHNGNCLTGQPAGTVHLIEHVRRENANLLFSEI